MHMNKLFLAALIALSNPVHAADRPVVLELFTSQGCSSCPPADALLGALAERPDVVALSWHVDYWDHIGWTDRFALPEATARQRDYARALKSGRLYTPQLVVDGRLDVVGSDRARIMPLVARRPAATSIAATIGPAGLSVRVGAGAGEGDVAVVPFLKQARTPVGRGENSGRTLTESHLARGIVRLGRWTGAAMEFTVPASRIAPDATHVALLVQAPGGGAFLAAAIMDLRRP